MYRRDDSFRASVPIGIAGPHLIVPAQQDIITAPGVDGQALNTREPLQCPVDSFLYMGEKNVYIPDQVTILLCHAIRETVDLLCPDLSALRLAHNVPTRGDTDINC